MRIISRTLSALALVTATGLASAGDVPATKALPSLRHQQENQRVADELALVYRTSGQLRNYAVDIEVDAGIVTLSGSVLDSAQKASLLSLTRQHPGVVSVLDKTKAQIADELMVTNYQPPAARPPMPVAPRPPAPGGPMPPPPGGPRMMPAPAGQGGGPIASEANRGAAPIAEPAPIHHFPGGVAPYSDSPTVPPYAWPSYTPYNNYASLAYQTQYPSGAWPFIGPPHPYPMIPSGWRRVSLTWKKGYWWMRFNAF